MATPRVLCQAAQAQGGGTGCETGVIAGRRPALRHGGCGPLQRPRQPCDAGQRASMAGLASRWGTDRSDPPSLAPRHLCMSCGRRGAVLARPAPTHDPLQPASSSSPAPTAGCCGLVARNEKSGGLDVWRCWTCNVDTLNPRGYVEHQNAHVPGSTRGGEGRSLGLSRGLVTMLVTPRA
jgi:hypothetical protein